VNAVTTGFTAMKFENHNENINTNNNTKGMDNIPPNSASSGLSF